ncbi:MAG: energy transducer TonB [Bacteroidales bacterium]|nr:energy transducer TonB [Bacteroidales bacterium]
MKQYLLIIVLFFIVFVLNAQNQENIQQQSAKKQSVQNYTAGDWREDDYVSVNIVDKMPEYPGGLDSLYQYLLENIQYPVDAREKGEKGTVLVEFVVDKDGSVTNVGVVTSVSPALDEEALRVVRSFPKWKPGEKDGQKVRVHFNIPIQFEQN